MVQDLFAHDHLAAATAAHAGTPTPWFLAGCLAHCDLEFVGVSNEGSVGGSVLSFRDVVAGEWFGGETIQTHDILYDGYT